jgi:hypothetical protein
MIQNKAKNARHTMCKPVITAKGKEKGQHEREGKNIVHNGEGSM